MNALFPGSADNVLLLRPLTGQHAVIVLPAVDPFEASAGGKGIVVAQIFAIKKGSEEAFANAAAATFAGYRASGMREAGVLVSLDAENNFPQLPIRSDGPFLVWFGVARDEAMLQRSLQPLATQAARTLSAGGLLRGAPELLILDPTARSRLRWWPNETPR